MAGFHEKVMTGGAITKFGILPGDLDGVLEIVKRYDLTVVGLHEHTGSGLYDENKVYESMKNLLSIASPGNFPSLRFIDFGGGFAVPYRPDDTKINYEKFGNNLKAIFKEYCSEYGRDLELYFEPGKYIVAESGYLLMEANTVKDNRGRLIVGTNSGFPQLIRPTFYGAYHQVVNLTNPLGDSQTYDVCGNICETGDVFAKQRELPEVREGDLLAIQNAGAYCYSMGGVYNLRAMPAEVFCFEGKAELSRRRLSNNELVENILRECK
jgi:diaminopimelate decarboxylase